ncbi:hypothetical protein PHYBOEH_006095 [Phytophthora boehmeriae]|uniref:Bzip transcription factor n=1 Tax=Phytophthora boehmeriae TaxID=109152 RepID=A0A8T1X7M5_9STRA|nr:hypothetical protein PHYBOEH_006095 [Phytophthora boehmeriae]
MATDLTKSVERLKQDIYKLELQQQRLACVTSPSGSVWEAVAKYFKLFERGYTFFTMKELPEQNKPQSAQNHVQLEFLRSMMELDVTDGPLCGAEALLDNWRLLSLYHDDLHVQLKRLEQGPNNSLVATATIGLTITANTLLNVYPHLLTGVEAASDRGGWPPLASKLLNQRLEVLASVRFDWESDCGRVVRLESKADLLAPILRLVGSLENVARVFDGALVTPELRVTKVVQ